MRVLRSWLREFAPLDASPEELGEALSDLGMAVESMDRLDEGTDGVVVARVLDLRPHPDADRIQLVDVDAGDGEPLQICCGAFNMAVGDRVPLATLGTTMPNGMRIERRKMRGEWSNGMLCSAAELGLGDDHGGILVLGGDPEPGAPLAEALGLAGDVLYDLEINPNRPDALSVVGVARDVAARFGAPFTLPDPSPPTSGADATGRSSVTIEAPDLCGRFLARVLDGVVVGPSPTWLATRLTLAGMRPINNVVDVSNYVMLELGQPNHTYDLDRLPGGELRVRWARDGEVITTLDDVERTLTGTDGVIADAGDVPVGIAGVMGGASTEIGESTTSVLLELAWWAPMAIAVSSQRLGLRSEASMRFERGTDPEVLPLAARRFAELLAASGATLAPGTVDERGTLPDREAITVRPDRVDAVLGTDLGGEEMIRLLRPIGFAVEPGQGGLAVTAPSFRPDTTTEIDVIEEVARHHGYGNIPRRVPPTIRTGGLSAHQVARRDLRRTLVGLGLTEAMPLPFLAPGDLGRAGLGRDAVTVTNPLDAAESVLRTSLRPGLLKAIAYNESHRSTGLKLFEVGKVFGPPASGARLPDEGEALAVVLAGDGAVGAVETWHVLADSLGIPATRLDQHPVPGLHPTRSAEIVLVDGDRRLGVVGEIDPVVCEAFAVAERVGLLELDLDLLLDLPLGAWVYRPVSRFPSSDIDLAFDVAEDTPAAAVEGAITDAAGELLADLRLFDVYRGDPLPPGRRSLAYALRLQAADRTLTDGEVAEVRRRVIEAVEGGFPARLRG